jgi:c-di-GMP-binding flagellar brake protein YcgR
MLQKYFAQLAPNPGTVGTGTTSASLGTSYSTHANGRDFFRVALPEIDGTMEVIEVGQRPVKTEPKEIQIIDGSGSGLAVLCQDDLQIRRTVIAMFSFHLGETDFQFRGVLVRKVDDMRRFEYGVRFIDVDERQQGALISILGRLQVQRHRATGGAKSIS